MPSVHSAQSIASAAGRPIRSAPSRSVPVPTVINAIAGAPQNWDITGSRSCARTVAHVHVRNAATVRNTSSAASRAHT
ncbi:hypothetical protein BBK82_33045 [Lentzea guizhouensis]|uniref:Uncharacterized protein n=1 Tax=Lentzea guizhouensis TaxID=1586287 RepID=A0A1B2HQY0_9PSEU|nr:hypothetical protein BBK82_33045 [Lentzea guizhouensis]